MKFFIVFIVCYCLGVCAMAQTNCSLYTDSNWIKACGLYKKAVEYYQGSRMCQLYLDSAMRVCPDYADAWREFSVPYLKRGDFLTWRRYMDKAVALKPNPYLGTRGWCRFKFLRDYEGALDDLKRYDTLTQFNPGPGGDGHYNLYIVMALCERELGHYREALDYFSKGIDSIYNQKGLGWLGYFDYLHRAVTKIRMKDYHGALTDLEQQMNKMDKYAEAWYYKGTALQLTGRRAEAKASFEKAKRLFIADGYHLTDVYCEMPDVVYLSDIEEALAKMK